MKTTINNHHTISAINADIYFLNPINPQRLRLYKGQISFNQLQMHAIQQTHDKSTLYIVIKISDLYTPHIHQQTISACP
jgi:hypothetical protein